MLLTTLLAAVLSVCPQEEGKVREAPLLARGVPEDAIFLAQITRIDSLRADFEASAWHGFWRDEEMDGLRGWIEAKLTEEGEGEIDEDLGVDPWELLDSIHGSIALFGVAQPGRDDPAFGLLVEPGEPRGAFEDAYAKLLDRQKRTGIVSSAEYEGVEIVLIEEKQDADEGAEEPSESEDEPASKSGHDHAAFFDAGGWVGSTAGATREGVLELVHGMIDRMSGKDPSSGLEGGETLSQARASVASPGRLEVFVDIAKIVSMTQVGDPPSEEDERVLAALGVEGLRWVYGTGNLGKGETVSFDVAVRLPEQGYLREWIELLGTIPREMAGMMPRASTSISLCRFDVWGLWQSAWELAADLDEESAEQAKVQLDAAQQQIGGVDLEKDFLSQIDGRFGSFNIPVPEEEWKGAMGMGLEGEESIKMPNSGSATIIGFKDVTAVSGFVEDALTAVGIFPQVETEEFQGTTIHKLQMGPGPGIQWAFTKKTGVISQFPTALRAALRMEGAEAKESALEKESFKPLIEAHAQSGALGLANTAESLKIGLSVAGMIQGMVGMQLAMADSPEGEKFLQDNPLDHLPSPAAIDRHFKGTILSAVTRKGGVLHLQMAAR